MERVANALQARGLLVDFVDAVGSVGEWGKRLASVCVYAKELCNRGFLSTVLAEGVSDISGELRSGCDNHCLSRVDRTVQVSVGCGKPELAGFCDEEMHSVSFADALELYVVDIKFERDVSVDGAVRFDGFKAV